LFGIGESATAVFNIRSGLDPSAVQEQIGDNAIAASGNAERILMS